MITKKIEAVPVVNEKKQVVEVLFWSEIFKDSPQKASNAKLGVPLVIMAGGKGTRLDPFTKILPKPLIPIGEKPIIELIIDRFMSFGVDTIYISINYKGEMIKSYFDYQENMTAKIRYLNEKEFLGTAGSLKLLPDEVSGTFIVSNCDIIVDADYHDVVRHHVTSGNALTLVGSIQHYQIPYGIIQFNSGGIVEKIVEKPEYDLTVNTGIYVVERETLKYIPDGKLFHVTDLINKLLGEKKQVGVYPVSEKSYIDLGQWEEYKKAIRIFNE
jgi:NDP-sugar pyrophosphorylase family protein